MRMLVSVEFADGGTKTGTQRVLVVGGCRVDGGQCDLAVQAPELLTDLRCSPARMLLLQLSVST
jgi:hypothetical protein